jgi:hypothetical protein
LYTEALTRGAGGERQALPNSLQPINKTPPVPQPNEQFRRESNYSNKAHLTRGFLSAGAKQVVGALWSVNDAATSELMAKFYQKMLQGGQKPAAALREA